MKTIFKLSATAGLLFTAAVGMAKEPELKLISNGDERGFVYQSDIQSAETSLKLMDDASHIIFIDKVSSGMYAKRFNLSSLNDGNYYFSAENSIKTRVYTLNIDDGELSLLESTEKSKPVFRKKGGRLFLNLLNLDGNNVEIKVMDGSDRVVFKETIANKTVVEKVFNFEGAFEDTYTVIVRDDEQRYYEYMTVFN